MYKANWLKSRLVAYFNFALSALGLYGCKTFAKSWLGDAIPVIVERNKVTVFNNCDIRPSGFNHILATANRGSNIPNRSFSGDS
jgi:hypothetical protein